MDEMPAVPPTGIPRWYLVLAFTAVGLLFFRQIAPCYVDGDVYHQMSLAREIVQERAVPWQDHFAFTPTVYPVVHHEWGAGLIVLGLTQLLGPAALLLLKFGGAAVLSWLVVATARPRADAVSLLLVLPLAAALVVPAFATVRAQLYTLCFAALLLWFLERDRAGARWWMVLWLPIYVIWLNLHAGFLVGGGLLFVAWAGRAIRGEPHRHLFLLGLVMAALIVVNPYGVNYYQYLLHAVALARPHIAEWQPLWHRPALLGWVLLAAGLSGYSAWYSWGRLVGIELVAATFAIGVSSERMIPYFGLCFAVYVPAWLQGTPLVRRITAGAAEARWLPAFCAIAAGVFLIAGVTEKPWCLQVPGRLTSSGACYPVGAVDYLRSVDFHGNVMVPFDWGSFVSWHLGPEVRVSMDARYEAAYPPEIERESYAFFMAEPGWQQTLEKYPVDLVLVPAHLPVATGLAQQSAWAHVYSDGTFEIFTRPGLRLPSFRGEPRDGSFP